MADDIFMKLGERLNQNPVKMPLIEQVLDFLRHVFTEEQAALGAAFPTGAHTSADLAKRIAREEGLLIELLEGMADDGLVFVAVDSDGNKEYSLTPFAPGLIEFQLMRGGESPEDHAKARMLVNMIESVEVFAKDIFTNPEIAAQVIQPGLRTLTVESELPLGTGVQPYERVAENLEKETAFASTICHCRHQAKLVGSPCKVEDAPEQSCLYFGKAADFMIERGFADRITKEDCFDILKACAQAGLVHNINNFQGDNIVLCNCCGCCCDFMVKMKKYRGLIMIDHSNFVAAIDPESCTGCGECVERCQFDAISQDGDIAAITPDYCAGCGNCVSVCPVECISIFRRGENSPRRKPDYIVGLGA